MQSPLPRSKSSSAPAQIFEEMDKIHNQPVHIKRILSHMLTSDQALSLVCIERKIFNGQTNQRAGHRG